jgi:hypothetical protein
MLPDRGNHRLERLHRERMSGCKWSGLVRQQGNKNRAGKLQGQDLVNPAASFDPGWISFPV